MKHALLLVLSGIWVQTAVLVGGPEPVEARDYKAVLEPAPIEKECRWTGIYFGGHGGYAWGDLTIHELADRPDDDNPFFDLDQNSFFGGGQVGFNLQLGSWFVLGVEGEGSWGDFDDRAEIFQADIDETTFARAESDWFATVAGRIGVSFWHNRLLSYVKGGAVFTEFDYEVGSDEESGGLERWRKGHDRTAALIGTGLEYAFNCHWSIKVEYQHFFFDDDKLTAIEMNESLSEAKTNEVRNPEMDSVKLGLNYKF